MEDVPPKITFRDTLTLSSQILAQTLTLHRAHGGPISMTSESYVTCKRATHAPRLHAGVNTPHPPLPS